MVQQIRASRLSLTYPPRIEFGSLQKLSSPKMFGNQIKMFCETVKGERVLLPDWGLPKLVHRVDISNAEVAAIIKSNLIKYFPAMTFEVTSITPVDTLPGKKEVTVRYAIGANQDVVVINL